MVRVRRRDAKAFEALYDRHHALVYGLAMRLLSDVAAAEDVTQAVFLKLWRMPHAFEQGNFPGWICRVTHNSCVDVLRTRARQAPAELMPDVSSLERPEDAAFARLEAAAVRKALAHIAPQERSLIEMAFFSQLTHGRIADATGLPLGTVKTRIRAGLHRLHGLLLKETQA